MANVIKPKRSNTASAVPTTGQLASGELAVNMADKKVYINNGTAVVQVGAGNLSGLGDVSITTPSNGQSLIYNGTNWINQTSSGSGDVVGPASSTDNAITRFDGTTGKLIQNSIVTLDDNGNLQNLNGIAFDTTPTSAPTAQGAMFWDNGNGTPSVVLNTNTSLQLGQENVALVYNGTGSTITKGQVVAVSGAQGQRPSVVLADADSEPLSAGTLGIAAEDIANGAEGFICTFGLVRGLNTSAFTAGDPVWLSSTAGAFTKTKPVAPQHTVFLGWVISINASSGELFVNISNGWELDELHNVLITSPASGNTLIYDATAGVWKNANLTDGTGITITEGAGSITVANSGVLGVTGTSPVASSGGQNPAISLASGYGDTQNPYASKTANFFLAAPNGTAGVPTFRAIVAADVPTLNQNTTGTASNVTGTVAIANGGTGQTTQQAAINALAGAVTSGQYLRGNGTNVVMSAIQAGDVPTLNQNTTGTASNVTGTVAIANGGTGATTAPTARTNLGATTVGSNLFTLTNPSAITFPRFNADNTVSALDAATFRTAIGAGTGSGTVTSVSGTGTVSGLTLTGTVTSSGSLTLGGNLSITADMIYDNFTATASQTTFTTSQTYTSGKIDVFANGVRMVNGSDVTVTSGTSVVFATGLAAGTNVNLVYPI